MRLLLAVAIIVGISGGAFAQQQQQPCPLPNKIQAFFLNLSGRTSPETRAVIHQHDVCEYKNCIMANPNNLNACEGLRHIMDDSR
jgi:hypothetical protein